MESCYRQGRERLKGYILIVAAAVCWGHIGIFSAVAFAEGVGPMEVAFWRAVISWFFFGSQAIIRKETQCTPKDIPLLIVFGLLGISLFYIAYLYAVKEGGAALASVLLYTAPAWVIACSFFIYKEKLTINKIIAVILVAAGVFFISSGGGTAPSGTATLFKAVLAGMVSGFCYSLYYTIGKYFSSRYSSANLFFYILPIGALGVLPFVTFSEKTPLAWTAMIALALLSTFIANQCYYLGLQYLEAGRASIVATIEPVVAAVAAYFFLGEFFSPAGYAGAVMILGAVMLTIYKK